MKILVTGASGLRFAFQQNDWDGQKNSLYEVNRFWDRRKARELQLLGWKSEIRRRNFFEQENAD